MNIVHPTPAPSHTLRLVFPPVVTLLILCSRSVIARGSLTADTFTQYIFSMGEAYLLAWGLLFVR